MHRTMSRDNAQSDTTQPNNLDGVDTDRDTEAVLEEPQGTASARVKQAQVPGVTVASPRGSLIESAPDEAKLLTAARVMLRNILELASRPRDWIGTVDNEDYAFDTPIDEHLGANTLHNDAHLMLSYFFIRAVDTSIGTDKDQKHNYKDINVHFTGQLNEKQMFQDAATIRNSRIPATAVWRSVFKVLRHPGHMNAMSEIGTGEVATCCAISRRLFRQQRHKYSSTYLGPQQLRTSSRPRNNSTGMSRGGHEGSRFHSKAR